MDLKIMQKKEEPLLSRIRLTGSIIFEATTPSNKEVRKKISSSLNCDEKLTVIKNIYTKFGIKKADFLGYVYHNEEAMKKIEPSQKKKKAEAEKPVEKPKEAKEKPKEEKEQPKEEKRPEEPPKEKKP